MKVARSALPVTLAHWERAGVRETVMAAATYILWGGADAMAVSDGPPRNVPPIDGTSLWSSAPRGRLEGRAKGREEGIVLLGPAHGDPQAIR